MRVELGGPLVPPRRDPLRDRFDNQTSVSVDCLMVVEQRGAIAIVQLVDDECRDDHRRVGRKARPGRVRATDVGVKAERLVGEARFLERPRMRIEAEHAQRRRGRRRNRRTGDAGAAAQIDDGARGEREADFLDDVLHEQEMERTVVERKGGALAGAIERLVVRERGFAPLDVRRRQRPQRPRHLAETQIGEMPFFELLDEAVNGQLETGNWKLVTSSIRNGVDDGI